MRCLALCQRRLSTRARHFPVLHFANEPRLRLPAYIRRSLDTVLLHLRLVCAHRASPPRTDEGRARSATLMKSSPTIVAHGTCAEVTPRRFPRSHPTLLRRLGEAEGPDRGDVTSSTLAEAGPPQLSTRCTGTRLYWVSAHPLCTRRILGSWGSLYWHKWRHSIMWMRPSSSRRRLPVLRRMRRSPSRGSIGSASFPVDGNPRLRSPVLGVPARVRLGGNDLAAPSFVCLRDMSTPAFAT